jgi:hypothetical protein
MEEWIHQPIYKTFNSKLLLPNLLLYSQEQKNPESFSPPPHSHSPPSFPVFGWEDDEGFSKSPKD